MKRERKEPLYRKEKKTGLQDRYRVKTGGEARWDRNTKAAKKDAENEVAFQPIKGRKNRRAKWGNELGMDYTPLFRFLLSKVGQNWDEVYSEAKSRLDKEEPIWYMVHDPRLPIGKYDDPDQSIFCHGEGSYWSVLTIDENNILVKVDPEAVAPTWLGCGCHTHSFNGKPYEFDRDAHNRHIDRINAPKDTEN